MGTENRLKVGTEHAGATLAAFLRAALGGGMPWSKARELVSSGKVRLRGEIARDPALRLAAGDEVVVDERAPRLRAGVLEDDRIVHADRDVVVVRKPAGVLSVPYAEGDKDTLIDLTRAALRRRGGGRGARRYDPMLGAVQRLDKDTTGLMVFARTLEAKRSLQQQLRDHSIERKYFAIVHGPAHAATHDTYIVPDRGDGLRGSWGRFRPARGGPPGDGKRAITHVKVVEKLRGATVVECRLETGRQHQIRIHLSEAGNPLVGETVYFREWEGPRIESPRPMLHAAVLGFDHPRTGERVRFEDPPPPEFEAVRKRLR